MNKTKRIAIRVSESEYEALVEKASGYGLTISRFLRDLSMNYPVTCIVDQKVAHDILNVAGDLGRLGGLFKHWLVKNEDIKASFSAKRSYEDIDEVVDQILDLQQLLKDQVLRIFKNDSQKSDIQKA